MSAFPFRFYGRRPADWYEGANAGHLYEIAFAQAPALEARAELEAMLRAAFERSAVELGPAPFRWSDRWMLLTLGERRPGRIDAFFDRVERALRALHAHRCIEQVVFWGARGPSAHAWDRWTLEAAATPAAGPAWEGLVRPTFYGV